MSTSCSICPGPGLARMRRSQPRAVAAGTPSSALAAERVATDAPPASAADLRALGLAVDRV